MKNKHGFGLFNFIIVIAFISLLIVMMAPVFIHTTYKAIKDNPFTTTNVVRLIHQKKGWVQFVNSEGVTNELPREKFCKIYTYND